jgi:hypothetical protein
MDTSDARAAFMPALFGDDGTRRVPLKEVREYFTRLNKDLAELEFKHYDFEVWWRHPRADEMFTVRAGWSPQSQY